MKSLQIELPSKFLSLMSPLFPEGCAPVTKSSRKSHLGEGCHLALQVMVSHNMSTTTCSAEDFTNLFDNIVGRVRGNPHGLIVLFLPDGFRQNLCQ